MPSTFRITLAWSLLAFAAGSFLFVATNQSNSADPKQDAPAGSEDRDQAKFMRKKLEASNAVLEGLVNDNSESIVRGARTLVEMSGAEKWQVKNDVMYRQFSNEFQRSATQLRDEAEKRNFDAVALKWIDVTLKCIECHRFVRGARLVDGKN